LSSSPDGVEEAWDEAALCAWLRVRNTLEPDDPLRLEQLLARRRAEPQRRELLARVDGVPVGVASVGPKGAPPDLAYGYVGVLLDRRHGGLGTALLEAISTIARSWGRSSLELWAREDESDGIAFLTRRGYQEVMRERGLALDVAAAVPPAAPPAGIGVAPVSAARAFAMGAYEVAAVTWRDIPGEEGIPERDAWLAVNADDAPDGALVALDGDVVVGFAGLHRLAAEGLYEHGLLAVLPDYRRRGIARALKFAQIEWVRTTGGRRLVTWNAAENRAARELNLSMGYEPLPASIAYRGVIE
jgi:GNAT superfamily N-acetyltransferase